jgi:hypothetical protein
MAGNVRRAPVPRDVSLVALSGSDSGVATDAATVAATVPGAETSYLHGRGSRQRHPARQRHGVGDGRGHGDRDRPEL